MLKHVHLTNSGGRSACSTPVMGSGRHSRSPSCSVPMGNGGGNGGATSTSSLMRPRRQSDSPLATAHVRHHHSQSMLTTIAANLLSSSTSQQQPQTKWDESGCRVSGASSSASSLMDPARVGMASSMAPKSSRASLASRKEETDSLGPLTLSAASSYTSLNQLINSPNSSFDSSSTASSLSPGSSTTTVKIYARCLRPDIEYKTLSISYQTTCKEVVQTLLNKYRMKHRDPNLFYLTMEVWIKKNGVPIRTLMVLEDEARPAELQSCHPRGESKFCLQIRRGGLVRVHDSCLMPGSQYKSILLSEKTTADELIQLLLNCYSSKEHYSRFALYEYFPETEYERKLHGDDCPLPVFQAWSSEQPARHLRIKRVVAPEPPPRRKLPWSRSLDFSTPPSPSPSRSDSALSSTPPSSSSTSSISSTGGAASYRNYENYFYI